MRLPVHAVARAPLMSARARAALVLACAFALASGACGATKIAPDADAHFDVPLTPRAGTVGGEPASTRRITAIVNSAQRVYRRETAGSKLRRETDRLSTDAALLRALARSDLASAQAEANAELRSSANHLSHVTRISVVSGPRVLVNATLNADGAFVVAPARRDLRVGGRALGTLLVSIQDVTGFVKLVHRRTLAEVVARGSSGQVRASLPAAAQARLPTNGQATIAGATYIVRSFGELGWGGEPLTVSILLRAAP
jgi:hypothetical protein